MSNRLEKHVNTAFIVILVGLGVLLALRISGIL